ncbi:MAG: hypothetical protein M1817_001217 [Caeruleum heppii]|nr:MAG: hypothetical protein M1817_001217 [Caeruleum heppii]
MLIERLLDYDVHDGSHRDLASAEFDHRVEAEGLEITTLLAAAPPAPDIHNLANNRNAVCVITTVSPNNGWHEELGPAGAPTGRWQFNPLPANFASHQERLNNAFGTNVRDNKAAVDGAFVNNAADPTKNVDVTTATAIQSLSWPNDAMPIPIRSRFAADQQLCPSDSTGSAYHLGNGLVGTAGHCIEPFIAPISGTRGLNDLRVVFGWSGNVRGKWFDKWQICPIERVLLCENPGPQRNSRIPIEMAQLPLWSRRWDTAIIKITLDATQLARYTTCQLHDRPASFGHPVYNIGAALGGPLKVSAGAHVLRHAANFNNNAPLSHEIDPYGTFSTDLDQFEGNSGCPVFSGETGRVVGHTTSTMTRPYEMDRTDENAWEAEFMADTPNYKALKNRINPKLRSMKPTDPDYLLAAKYTRCILGSITDHYTICMAGEKGLNRQIVPMAPPQYAAFNRAHWTSQEVIHMNLSGRVDRSALFLKPVHDVLTNDAVLANPLKKSTLRIRFIFDSVFAGAFASPSADGRVVLTTTAANIEWPIPTTSRAVDAHYSRDGNSFEWTLSLNLEDAPAPFKTAPGGLSAWTSIRLEQKYLKQPTRVGLLATYHRRSFAFPPNALWPPNGVGVSATDAGLQWPEETFQYATTGQPFDFPVESTDAGALPRNGVYHRTARLGNVWTHPRQPAGKLLAGFMAGDLDAGVNY